MKYYTYRGNLILDPYGGTGTTATVCAKNGRDYLYIDKSKEYRDIAFDRVKSVILGKGNEN